MSAQHTPGPWVAQPICTVSRWVDIVRIDENGMPSLPFAACKHFDQEANARLIAAAPYLLSSARSLQFILRAMATELGIDPETTEFRFKADGQHLATVSLAEALHKTDAAITKATGAAS